MSVLVTSKSGTLGSESYGVVIENLPPTSMASPDASSRHPETNHTRASIVASGPGWHRRITSVGEEPQVGSDAASLI
jgi:hypothetical protein